MKAINVKGSNFDFENCTNGGDGHARHHDSTPPTEPYPHFYTKKGGESDSPDALCPAGGGGVGNEPKARTPLNALHTLQEAVGRDPFLPLATRTGRRHHPLPVFGRWVPRLNESSSKAGYFAPLVRFEKCNRTLFPLSPWLAATAPNKRISSEADSKSSSFST